MEQITSDRVTTAKTAKEEVAGASLTEGVGGAGAIILAIIALVGVLPVALASIAAIAIGAALLVGGGTIAARYSSLLARTQVGYARDIIGGGMAMESVCGVAGIALGILSLLGLAPMTLLPVASIVFGGALLIASGAMARLNSLPIRGAALTEESHYIARDVLYVASGAEVLVGAAAIVLGILALTGHDPLILVLVAFLSVGTSVMLSGSSIAARIFSVFYR